MSQGNAIPVISGTYRGVNCPYTPRVIPRVSSRPTNDRKPSPAGTLDGGDEWTDATVSELTGRFESTLNSEQLYRPDKYDTYTNPSGESAWTKSLRERSLRASYAKSTAGSTVRRQVPKPLQREPHRSGSIRSRRQAVTRRGGWPSSDTVDGCRRPWCISKFTPRQAQQRGAPFCNTGSKYQGTASGSPREKAADAASRRQSCFCALVSQGAIRTRWTRQTTHQSSASEGR